jgi:hypothetical protein
MANQNDANNRSGFVYADVQGQRGLGGETHQTADEGFDT